MLFTLDGSGGMMNTAARDWVQCGCNRNTGWGDRPTLPPSVQTCWGRSLERVRLSTSKQLYGRMSAWFASCFVSVLGYFEPPVMIIKRDLTSAKPKQPHESEMSTSTWRAFFAVSLWLSQEPHSSLGKLEGLLLSAEDLNWQLQLNLEGSIWLRWLAISHIVFPTRAFIVILVRCLAGSYIVRSLLGIASASCTQLCA